MNADLKIAVVHEWISATAGSEKVFEAIAEVVPSADLYCLTREPGVSLPGLTRRPINVTVLDRVRSGKWRPLALPIMPIAWRRLDRPRYDVVISSSHAFARWFVTPNDGLHLSYVHAPMRYVWNPEIDSRLGQLDRLAAPARVVLAGLDRWTTGSVDAFAANSNAVADRLQSYYGRASEVIHPPVDTKKFAAALPVEPGRAFLVSGGRLISYKRHDLAIRAAKKLDMPLKMFGTGPALPALQRLASSLDAEVQFLGRIEDVELRQLLASATLMLYPAIEDFGILPVECLAAGTPVVGVARGGMLDIRGDSNVAALAESQEVEAIAEAAQSLLDQCPPSEECRDRADSFSEDSFRTKFRDWYTSTVARLL